MSFVIFVFLVFFRPEHRVPFSPTATGKAEMDGGGKQEKME